MNWVGKVALGALAAVVISEILFPSNGEFHNSGDISWQLKAPALLRKTAATFPPDCVNKLTYFRITGRILIEMKVSSFEAIVRALNEAEVRFIVVGGIAVAAHGYLRQTKDVDLVIDLFPENITAALEALEKLGYFPRIPVTPQQFADRSTRLRWIEEKHMLVLNLYSDAHFQTPIDVFVVEPFPFAGEYSAALIENVAEGVPVRIVSLNTLLQMRKEAGRPHGLIDIEQLGLLGKAS